MDGNIIRKKHLNLRAAWQVGRNDFDFGGILPDDEPIIPPDETSVPVLELLDFKRELHSLDTASARKTFDKKRHRELEKKQNERKGRRK